MLLIERHVSAYSEAIIRFNKLYETIYLGFKLLDAEISSSILYGNIQRKNYRVCSCDGVRGPPGTPSQLQTLQFFLCILPYKIDDEISASNNLNP